MWSSSSNWGSWGESGEHKWPWSKARTPSEHPNTQQNRLKMGGAYPKTVPLVLTHSQIRLLKKNKKTSIFTCPKGDCAILIARPTQRAQHPLLQPFGGGGRSCGKRRSGANRASAGGDKRTGGEWEGGGDGDGGFWSFVCVY